MRLKRTRNDLEMNLRRDLRWNEVGSASRNSRVRWGGLRAPGNKPRGLCARVLGDACLRHVLRDRGTYTARVPEIDSHESWYTSTPGG